MGRGNKGYITVEASLVVPLFLFFMVAVSGIAMLLLAEAHIHQSLAEAADYTAQYCYLEKKVLPASVQSMEGIVNLVVLKKQFDTYMGEDFYVERMVSGGRGGILLSVEADRDNPKVFTARAGYLVKIAIPVLGEFHIPLSVQIKQKAFLGYSKEEKSEPYVYVTPNQSVYHVRRNCTHLTLSVQSKRREQAGNYVPCGFCGKEYNRRDIIYVARTGNVYHYRAGCSGLKRTVKRVKLSETGGLGACSRCGKQGRRKI